MRAEISLETSAYLLNKLILSIEIKHLNKTFLMRRKFSIFSLSYRENAFS